MSFELFDIVFFPLKLELIFLIAYFICSSTMLFGKSLLLGNGGPLFK